MIHTFKEHNLTVSGEKDDLIFLAEKLREVGAEGTWGDIAHKIEDEFGIYDVEDAGDESTFWANRFSEWVD